MSNEVLADPYALGAEVVKDFVSASECADILAETQDSARVQWLDAHETYTVDLCRRTKQFVRGLSPIFPSLASWEADELSFHLYDDAEVGLSRHRDNSRFIGLIAIVAIDGECDLVVTHNEQAQALAVQAGDLCLLRAPGLIETDLEIRPEHSVENLRTDTRLSMMLRANARPTEAIRGFRFNNWQPI